MKSNQGVQMYLYSFATLSTAPLRVPAWASLRLSSDDPLFAVAGLDRYLRPVFEMLLENVLSWLPFANKNVLYSLALARNSGCDQAVR